MSCVANLFWGQLLTFIVKRTVCVTDCKLFFICYSIQILYLAGEGYFIFSIMTCCFPAVTLEWLLFNICLIGLSGSAETTVDSLKEIAAFTLFSALTLLLPVRRESWLKHVFAKGLHNNLKNMLRAARSCNDRMNASQNLLSS